MRVKNLAQIWGEYGSHLGKILAQILERFWLSPEKDPHPEPWLTPEKDPPLEPWLGPAKDPPREPWLTPEKDPPLEPWLGPEKDPPPEPWLSPEKDPPPEPWLSPEKDPPPEPCSTAVGTVEFRSLVEPVRVSNPEVTYLEADCTGIDPDRKVARCVPFAEMTAGGRPPFEARRP